MDVTAVFLPLMSIVYFVYLSMITQDKRFFQSPRAIVAAVPDFILGLPYLAKNLINQVLSVVRRWSERVLSSDHMPVTDGKCVELGSRQPDSSGLRLTEPVTLFTGGSNHDGWLDFGNALVGLTVWRRLGRVMV